jgi:signal transduction histidine kinase
MIKPIEGIIGMSKKIMQGDLTARCNIRPSGEMGILCTTIDQMADAIEQHEKTVQKETQMQIGQSEKLASVGRLVAGIAHEINNPLTGVLTFSHLLKEKLENHEDLKDIDIILQETTRVRDIVKGLLDFARQSPSTKESININEIIQQLLKLIKSQREFKDIKIIEKYEEDLPEFTGDKNQLQQVFLNLLLNSAEAIPETGTITISTSASKDRIEVTINDTGCGIKDEDMDKIFDPFYTTKPVGKGTGLGLSVSYGIIQQHSGDIKCESKEGIGTTFTILLPLNQNKIN